VSADKSIKILSIEASNHKLNKQALTPFLPRDALHPSVRLSVRLSVCSFVTLMNVGHMSWVSLVAVLKIFRKIAFTER